MLDREARRGKCVPDCGSTHSIRGALRDPAARRAGTRSLLILRRPDPQVLHQRRQRGLPQLGQPRERPEPLDVPRLALVGQTQQLGVLLRRDASSRRLSISSR